MNNQDFIAAAGPTGSRSIGAIWGLRASDFEAAPVAIAAMTNIKAARFDMRLLNIPVPPDWFYGGHNTSLL